MLKIFASWQLHDANNFADPPSTSSFIRHSNNESGWDEKEYEKMNKEYQKFLKDNRLPKERKAESSKLDTLYFEEERSPLGRPAGLEESPAGLISA